MKRWRRFEVALLTLATVMLVGGCSALPEESKSNPTAAMSCATRSAEVRPPKHPIVELAWCIALTNDLSDPNRLFHGTLGIKNDQKYGESKNVSWGVKLGVGTPEEIQHLPSGVIDFYYMRVDVDKPTIGGKRYLGFGIDFKKSCVTLADVVATFGDGYTVSPHPVVAPAPALPGVMPSPTARTGKFPGVFYVTPLFFNGRDNGRIHFDFDYQKCANHIAVQRDL